VKPPIPTLFILRRLLKCPYGHYEYEAFFAHPRPNPGTTPKTGDWVDLGVWKQAEAMILRRDEAAKVIQQYPDAVMVPVSNQGV